VSVIGASLAVGDANCPAGGSKLTSASGDTFVCNGAAGTQGPAGTTGATGPQGPQGAAGVSVAGQTLTVGNANCPFGGSKFISASGDTFACNGAPGIQGPKGDTGATGAKGDIGAQGATGAQGGLARLDFKE